MLAAASPKGATPVQLVQGWFWEEGRREGGPGQEVCWPRKGVGVGMGLIRAAKPPRPLFSRCRSVETIGVPLPRGDSSCTGYSAGLPASLFQRSLALGPDNSFQHPTVLSLLQNSKDVKLIL